MINSSNLLSIVTLMVREQVYIGLTLYSGLLRAWWNMGVPGYDYTYRDAVLEEPNGGVAAIQKDSSSLPMDPTSDAMKARLDYIMNKFIDCGFEFLKIDFLNYAALEEIIVTLL